MPQPIAVVVPESSTVRRVAQVLEVFLDGRADAGITEIARALGCSKSVIHRIVVSLRTAGFLAADAETRRYRLGWKAIELGLAAVAHTEILAHAGDHLRNVTEATNETAVLNLLHGETRIYAQQVEGGEPVRQTVRIGQEVPLYLGAAGKAILAFLPEPKRTRILQRARAARTNGQRLNVGALEKELDRIERLGYAVSRAELVPGAVSVAAPVFDRSGVVASITAAGVVVRSEPTRLARYADVVRQEARALSRKLGWSKVTAAERRAGRNGTKSRQERRQRVSNALRGR